MNLANVFTVLLCYGTALFFMGQPILSIIEGRPREISFASVLLALCFGALGTVVVMGS